MVTIRFRDSQAKRRALGWLAGRFGFTSWHTGEMLLPEDALAHLRFEGFVFEIVEGSPSKPSEGMSTVGMASGFSHVLRQRHSLPRLRANPAWNSQSVGSTGML